MFRIICLGLALGLCLNPARAEAQQLSANFPIPSEQEYLELLKIPVDPATPRVFLFTNKRAAFYAAMTSGPNVDPNQGLNVFGRKVLEDYQLAVDGKRLDRSAPTSVAVYPHAIVRTYPGGLQEEVAMLDGLDALVVTLRGRWRASASLAPTVAGPSAADAYQVETGERLHVTPAVGGDLEQRTPRTLVVGTASRSGVASHGARVRPPVGFTPGLVTEVVAPEMAGSIADRTARFYIGIGRSQAEATALADRLEQEAEALLTARRSRIAGLLLDTYVDTDDDRFDKALAWAKASGDALVTEQAGPGIWAGLYWFNNYWGRDTFISLPGILLVTGRYEEARRVLESFSNFQKTDEFDPLYGRIPNRVNSATDIIYNTADGTPWFVREAYEYVLYSGDTEFAKRIYPAIMRATDGTLRYRVDPNGLLVHDDADTWMDAKWEGKVPWSPRGDRAVDIQALWYAQLEASAELARMNGDGAAAARWRAAAARVRDAFRKHYRDPKSGALYDHLNADGTPDGQVRPNQIFALTVPVGEPLLTPEEGGPVVRQVVNELTYPYGVASLSQKDENFHPYHRGDERWHFDSAYHNGTVWVWNAGPVISALVDYGRQEMAYELTRSMVDQTLDMGAVGTLAELIEAIPREGRLKLSGTETQAWSVAEFVRNFYQDYLGLRPDATRGRFELDPKLPSRLGTVRAVLPLGSRRTKITITAKEVLVADRSGDWPRIHVVGVHPEGAGELARGSVGAGGMLARIPLANRRPAATPDLGALRFVTPHIYPYLKPLRGVPTPVVRATKDEIAVPEPAGARVLYEASDPEGDDRGPDGTYTYPTDGRYEPGILDLTGVRVAADEERYYFTLKLRHLVDPGWHPELGFQLTYAAIAIDMGGKAGSGGTVVGKKSGYTLPERLAFEKILYIGAGLELADAKNAPLMTYSPAVIDGALGSAHDGEIRFAIPRSYLGEWNPSWRFTVLVGGQDDGGTAGLGEFRAVALEASQWVGGGAPSSEASRVYDVLLPD